MIYCISYKNVLIKYYLLEVEYIKIKYQRKMS